MKSNIVRQQIIGTTLTLSFTVFVMWVLFTGRAEAKITEQLIHKEHISLSYSCGRTHGDRNHYAVCDGDTFKVSIKSGGQYSVLTNDLPIRLFSVDSPEYYSPNCEKELKMALQAKDLLTRILQVGEIELVGSFRGSHYRIVSDVYVNGENIKQRLLDSGLYKDYNVKDGRKKWCTTEESADWLHNTKERKRKIVREHLRSSVRSAVERSTGI
jgi:endonuclease YncB( thermonuclease family)